MFPVVGGIWMGDVIQELPDVVDVRLGESDAEGEDGGRVVFSGRRPPLRDKITFFVNDIRREGGRVPRRDKSG
jgi:hypothetical protein